MNIVTAKLFGILFETLGYGMFFLMFAYNTYLQMRNLSDRNAKRPNLLLLVFSIILFMLITSRWALEVCRLYEAVMKLGGRMSISEYFADLTLKKQVAVTSLIETQVIVADFILLYRLFHVWYPHWWLCVIPALTWLGAWVSASLLIWNMVHADPSPGVFQLKVERWVTTLLACTISNNVYCTSAIIVRLWKSHRVVAHASSNSKIWHVLKVFVESASLYTLFMTAIFSTFLAGSNLHYTFVDATSPVIGISFLLIMLRLNFDKHETTTLSGDTIGKRGASTNYPLRPINVNVSQRVDVDSDLESKAIDKSSYGDME